MKKFWAGFREFAFRGNVIDLAVGVIIGAAFKSIVDSLVSDIISPLIGLITGKNFSDHALTIGDVTIGYGAFFTQIVNFIIVAFALYLVITAVNRARSLLHMPAVSEPPPPPKRRLCPYCKMEIPLEAQRCAYCTQLLPAEGEEVCSQA